MTEQLHFHALEKEMATHSSVPAWKTPEMWEPGGLPSLGSHRVRHGWSYLAAAAHASKVMLKILQTRLQQYVNWELSDVQAGFRKGKGTRNQIANIRRIIGKAREFQKKHPLLLHWLKAQAFDCVHHNKLWKILQEMRIPDLLTCLLRNLYAGQEVTIRTGHGTTDWFQIGKRSMSKLYVVTVLT